MGVLGFFFLLGILNLLCVSSSLCNILMKRIISQTFITLAAMYWFSTFGVSSQHSVDGLVNLYPWFGSLNTWQHVLCSLVRYIRGGSKKVSTRRRFFSCSCWFHSSASRCAFTLRYLSTSASFVPSFMIVTGRETNQIQIQPNLITKVWKMRVKRIIYWICFT